jgi:hypothetical protein
MPYLGFTTVTIPPFPPAPASIEFGVTESVAASTSPFTFQQQVQDWGANMMVCSVSWPAMTDVAFQPWITFLRSLKGTTCVFQFNSAFSSQYPSSIGSRFWRINGNTVKWSIVKDRVYGFSFEIREVL